MIANGLDLVMLTLESFIDLLNKAIQKGTSLRELRDIQENILEQMRQIEIKDKQKQDVPSSE